MFIIIIVIRHQVVTLARVLTIYWYQTKKNEGDPFYYACLLHTDCYFYIVYVSRREDVLFIYLLWSFETGSSHVDLRCSTISAQNCNL
jgi:hypothetical protein